MDHQKASIRWIVRSLSAKRAREQITQSDMARKLGCTRGWMSQVESGAKIPSVRFLVMYAEALGGRIEFVARARAR